ncbi:MAG: HAMP domain-containing sensor histidine kinase [Gammaproteobacteria bacterium]|jgi:signal transduction histidine kinase
MQKRSGLIHKITRAFMLQAVLISIAAMLSVFFAKIVLEEILIKEAIKQEADYFWENYRLEPSFPLPDTSNLTGYFNSEQLPPALQQNTPEAPGFYEYKDNEIVLYVSQQGARTLYLSYNRGQVDTLAAYYGLFPLALVLIVLYLSLWLTYRFSRRTISPVSLLARQVNKIDIASRDLSPLQIENLPFDIDDDIQVLADAIVNLGERLDAFITREQNFTRDASHELRSPLTVINIAADMLLSEQELPAAAQKSVMRIKRAAADMEELTEAFLLLARESDQGLSAERVCINDIIEEEVERARLLNQEKQLDIIYSPQHKLMTQASDKVLSVLFGNLIRNAFLYTEEGSIAIDINNHSVIINDSGKGMPQQQVDEIFKPYYRGSNTSTHGYGVGLTIVKRLSDRFNWPIRISSTPGKGTRVEVQFPESDIKN